MSQKVRITGVKHSGASVYLGVISGNPTWTKNPNRIMDFLCAGWRYRFNQHRQYRTKRRPLIDPETQETVWVEVPLGGTDLPEKMTDSQARKTIPWLASLPSNVIHNAEKLENNQWWAALKRMSSASKSGQKVGRVPGFKSWKRSGQTFSCWYNGGRGAVFRQTGRKSGVVTISGQTPKAVQRPGEKISRYQIKIRVRVSQPIRPYTSVTVNWTQGTLVFTNEVPAREHDFNGSVIGLDFGVAKTICDSNGNEFHMPKPSEAQEQEYRGLQHKLARQDQVAEAEGRKPTESNRRERTRAAMNRILGHARRRRLDWAHKITTKIVQENDVIVIEDLAVKNMTKSARGTVENPGKNVRQKSGLNRSILQNNWGELRSMLDYKTKASGTLLVAVNPAYTSQTCSKCGHIAAENRESQAVFLCRECGFSANADENAALNILRRGLATVAEETGQDYGLGRGGEVRPKSSDDGSAGEASTPALVGSVA